MIYFEKKNSPGQLINLEYVASMNWDNGLTTQFLMTNGQTITWEYENEDDQMEDLDKLDNHLRNADKLISVELDQE
ncbi:MAG: hypothetical protein H8E18_14395 [FCB group bacterium]|nr:hypothetical protein [FCB group bacterium]